MSNQEMKIDAAVFDLFGTLLDITSLRTLAGNLVGEKKANELVARWRDKQIAYSFASSLMDRYEDFDVITARALDYVLAALDIEADAEMHSRLCDGWLELRPYPDATIALEALRSRGVRTAVLTNGTLATAKRALANSGLDSLLNDVWSIDEVCKYKPSPEVYALACMRLQRQP
ncbi:MAG: haloacid dehalogenase type II, partial [Vulcanimicrobiaceae bacterium]